METAGRAVVFSGTAVAIGLALMLFMPLPFMRGFGLGGPDHPARLGARGGDAPARAHLLARGSARPRALHSQAARSTGAPTRRTASGRGSRAGSCGAQSAVAAATIAALLLVALPILTLQLTPGLEHGHPAGHSRRCRVSTCSRRRSARARSRRPTLVGTRAGQAESSAPGVQAAIQRLAVESAERSRGRGRRCGARGRVRRPDGPLLPRLGDRQATSTGRPRAQEFVDRLRDEIVPAAGFPADVDRPRGRRPAGRRRLPRHHVRRVPVARARGARCSRTCCSCARSARCCCR